MEIGRFVCVAFPCRGPVGLIDKASASGAGDSSLGGSLQKLCGQSQLTNHPASRREPLVCVRRGWGRQAERMRLETCRGARNHRTRSLLIGPRKQNEKAHAAQRRCGTIPRPLDPRGSTTARSPRPVPFSTMCLRGGTCAVRAHGRGAHVRHASAAARGGVRAGRERVRRGACARCTCTARVRRAERRAARGRRRGGAGARGGSGAHGGASRWHHLFAGWPRFQIDVATNPGGGTSRAPSLWGASFLRSAGGGASLIARCLLP